MSLSVVEISMFMAGFLKHFQLSPTLLLGLCAEWTSMGSLPGLM